MIVMSKRISFITSKSVDHIEHISYTVELVLKIHGRNLLAILICIVPLMSVREWVMRLRSVWIHFMSFKMVRHYMPSIMVIIIIMDGEMLLMDFIKSLCLLFIILEDLSNRSCGYIIDSASYQRSK